MFASKIGKLVVGLAGLTLLSGGIVFGLGAVKGFAQSSEVINACANRVTGDLRVLKPGARCLRNETPLMWNQEGPQGPAASLMITRRTIHGTIPVHNYASVEAECDEDEVVTGGGYSIGSIGSNDRVFTDGPIDDRTWAVSVMNDTDYVLDVWVTAICAQIGPDETPEPIS